MGLILQDSTDLQVNPSPSNPLKRKFIITFSSNIHCTILQAGVPTSFFFFCEIANMAKLEFRQIEVTFAMLC